MSGNNLGNRFDEVVQAYGKENAIIIRNQFISYRELDCLSNRIARYLISKGLSKGDVVAISSIKKIFTYGTILACLKIGVIYCVVDRKSPIARLNKIFNNCAPKYIIADDRLSNACSDIDISIINIYNESEELIVNQFPGNSIDFQWTVESSFPVYIMYTSGSTGHPKGVTITHGNLIYFIEWARQEFDLGPGERLTNINPLFFDNSVFDIFTSLFTGSCLVPFSRDDVKKPLKLINKIDKIKCTLWFSVPSLLIYFQTLKIFDVGNLRYIKKIIFGGEGYPKPELYKLFELYNNRMDIFNVYGPTECTCICSSYQITQEDFFDMNGIPPLGKLLDNFDYIIIDEKNKEVSSDVIGELVLMGDQVGSGYYNDNKKTKGSFVQNPVNKFFSQKSYITGDLVRFNSNDNKLYFEGRKDTQIKHMGYRIELNEIEYALLQNESINEAAVMYFHQNGSHKIVGFISSSIFLDTKVIKSELLKILPSYMVPKFIYKLEILPKNVNGKIDRKKLIVKYTN